jgi:NTP pyrophosphatase (non-canonical NTP hydrolase)
MGVDRKGPSQIRERPGDPKPLWGITSTKGPIPEDGRVPVANADDLRDASPWNPMTDPTDLKVMGKLLEELGELTSAVSRCVIQGIDEVEPETLKPNRRWLEDEIADVLATIGLATVRFGIIPDHNRINRKKAHLQQWYSYPPPEAPKDNGGTHV